MVWFQTGAKNFFSKMLWTLQRPTQPPIQWVPDGIFSEVKAIGA